MNEINPRVEVKQVAYNAAPSFKSNGTTTPAPKSVDISSKVMSYLVATTATVIAGIALYKNHAANKELKNLGEKLQKAENELKKITKEAEKKVETSTENVQNNIKESISNKNNELENTVSNLSEKKHNKTYQRRISNKRNESQVKHQQKKVDVYNEQTSQKDLAPSNNNITPTIDANTKSSASTKQPSGTNKGASSNTSGATQTSSLKFGESNKTSSHTTYTTSATGTTQNVTWETNSTVKPKISPDKKAQKILKGIETSAREAKEAQRKIDDAQAFYNKQFEKYAIENAKSAKDSAQALEESKNEGERILKGIETSTREAKKAQRRIDIEQALYRSYLPNCSLEDISFRSRLLKSEQEDLCMIYAKIVYNKKKMPKAEVEKEFFDSIQKLAEKSETFRNVNKEVIVDGKPKRIISEGVALSITDRGELLEKKFIPVKSENKVVVAEYSKCMDGIDWWLSIS